MAYHYDTPFLFARRTVKGSGAGMANSLGVLRVAVVVATVLALAGCQTTGRKTVLRVANWGGAPDDGEFSRAVRELYQEFESQNPGVQIQVEGIPGSQDYVTKVLLSHVARTAPDIITLDASSAAAFIEARALRDLSTFMAEDSDFNRDDFYPNVFGIAQRGQKVFAVPMDFTPMVLYYNKDIFDQRGVPYPPDKWTYREFLTAAKALTFSDTYGLAFANWMPGWIMWFWNRGGDVISVQPDGTYRALGTLDSQTNAKTIEWLRDLIVVHKVAPNLSSTVAQGIDPFLNGKAAMQISGHWAMIGYGQQKSIKLDRIGVAPLPTDLARSETVMYQSGLAIGQHCKHPELAWKFIKFMTSKPSQTKYHAFGIAVSARIDVSANRATDEREAKFLRIVPSARPPWGAKVVGYDLVEEIGQRMMDAILRHNADPQQALTQAAQEIDKEMSNR